MLSTIEELRRAVATDPSNVDACIDLLRAHGRIDPDVLLDPLQDSVVWRNLHPVIQDLAIEETSRRVKEHFDYSTTKIWECPIAIGEPYRLATFRHRRTGMEMNLLPGSGNAVLPFLLGRWPVTCQQWNKRSSGPPHHPILTRDATRIHKWKKELRHPRVNEWLHACVSGTERFFWGDSLDPDYVWYRDNSYRGDCQNFDAWPDNPNYCQNCGTSHWREPSSIEIHEEEGRWNPYGLVDMVGNVWELAQWENGAICYLGRCYNSFGADFLQGMLGYVHQVENIAAGLRMAFSIPGLKRG